MKESQIIKTIDWFEGMLYVTLHNIKKVYEYDGVPEQVFEDFKNADSLGKYFAAHIKGKYPEQSFPEVIHTHNDPYPFPTTPPPEGFNHRVVKPEHRYKLNKPRPWNFPKEDPELEEFRMATDLTEEEEQELLDAMYHPDNDGMGGATT